MNLRERVVAIGSAVALALACSLLRAQEPLALSGCIDALRAELPLHPQVRPATFETHTRDVLDMRGVVRTAADSQPEFKLAIWDYIGRLVDAQRIDDGRRVLDEQSAVLPAIAARRGVDAATVVAVFGVETDYGHVVGRHRVIDATLSRACLDLKNKERKQHFFAALWLLQQGLVQPDNFTGSWAGAFGLTQFMPATFVAHMASASGTGPVDIVGSAPDALATTANYIASLGWTEGLRWGVEVAPPRGAARELIAAEREHACLGGGAAAGKCRSIEQWAALGVTALDGPPALPPGTPAALLAPSGPDGPAWLVTRNYRAIWQYNRADAYALAIGLLSDALRGDAPMRSAWPTDDAGLSRAEFAGVQRELIRRGYADVVADGYDGPRTRAAIKAEEALRGWPQTGRAGARIARALAEPPAAPELAVPPQPLASDAEPGQRTE